MNNKISPTGLAYDLLQRQQAGRPVRIGLVGCGEMGVDLLCRVSMMAGIEVCHIVTRGLDRVFEAMPIVGLANDAVVECNNLAAVYNTIELNKIAASTDLDLLLNNDYVEIIVDATGHPNAGAEIAYKSLQHGKHVVMMNVEADVTVGAFLAQEAAKRNLIYSIGAGDEPTACMELINFITSMGHKVICAGKGKNNPLKVDATPDQYADEAQRRNMNPRMLVEFVDGSKTMVEMACIANATGLAIDVDGMHGAGVQQEDLNKIYIPEVEGGILKNKYVVDYSTGTNIAPGVFAITEINHPRLRERMADLKLGDGPYYSFFRPYHLTAMEVPLTCARMSLYGKADMVPLPYMTAEVCAVAKKDLNIGDKLDFIGLYTYRAFTLDYQRALQLNALPCGLLEGASITKAVKKGELITGDNCQINDGLFIAKLRAKQNIMLGRS